MRRGGGKPNGLTTASMLCYFSVEYDLCVRIATRLAQCDVVLVWHMTWTSTVRYPLLVGFELHMNSN